MQPRIEQSLQQAEQIAPMAFQQMGTRSTLDGEDVVGLTLTNIGFAASRAPLGAVFFSLDSHPKFLSIIPPPSGRQMYEQMDPALSDEEMKAALRTFCKVITEKIMYALQDFAVIFVVFYALELT